MFRRRNEVEPKTATDRERPEPGVLTARPMILTLFVSLCTMVGFYLLLTMQRVPKAEYGLGSPLWNLAFVFGFVVGAAGFSWAFYLCAGLLVAAVGLIPRSEEGESCLTGLQRRAANMMFMKTGARGFKGTITDWLAWGRRSRTNKALFVVSLSVAAFVTGAFAWATIQPHPGDFARYFAYYWVWGLCAVALIFGMAEYKTSPLRKGRERGHLFILLYVGALLIITRALNMVLYGG